MSLKLTQKIKEGYEKYEKHISSITLITGFIFDNLTMRRIDLFFENLVFIIYLSIAAISIVLLSLHETGKVKFRWFEHSHLIILMVLQFAFGGLFSGFFIFYSRSGSLIANWPFILILLTLLLGNEIFKERYQSLVFRTTIFFLALFSFSIFYVPVVLKTMGPFVFLLSGLISLILLFAFVFLLFLAAPDLVNKSKKTLKTSILAVYLLINLLYFTNLIPPVPLSIKDSGIFHNIVKTTEGYQVQYEDIPWYSFFKQYKKINLIPGEKIYAFSSVFSPTNLNTDIVHEWQYYDEAKSSWVTKSRLDFSIVGGRDGGYRGYSYKTNIAPGKWRVNIETKRGQTIGRLKFKVENVEERPTLYTKIKK